jgi:RNA-binding protein 39
LSKGDNKHPEDEFSKDQRTIFVSQLVMRTTERDLKKYFKKKVGCKVNDVILLRDRRNARNHKGCAYVEVGRIEDVATAVAVSGQPPDFQRFPILVKASEAEKNYVNPLAGASAATNNTSNNASANLMTKTDGLVGPMSSATAVTPTTNSYANANATSSDQEKQGRHLLSSSSTTTGTGTTSFLPPLRDENGRLIESQKLYVGGLDPNVREEHLYALFSQFGTLQKVQLQYHPNTQISRGYAFLAFRDPKVSHLAIRTMTGKFVAGRPLKTGWANQNQQSPASIASGCTVVTSDQFPEDAADLTQKALSVLAQMTGGTTAAAVQQLTDTSMGASISANSGSNAVAIATMAEQELDKAIGLVGSTATTKSTSAQAIPTVAEARASMAAPGGAGSRPVLGGATVAEARASLAADMAARQLAAATSAAAVAVAAETRTAATAKSSFIGNTGNGPTPHLLVHNMYDKDEETEDQWEIEIKAEFLDECSKFGKIEHAKVMHMEPGGQIYATFADSKGAQTCAENLAGRWFDKRQLRVDYMPEANPP